MTSQVSDVRGRNFECGLPRSSSPERKKATHEWVVPWFLIGSTFSPAGREELNGGNDDDWSSLWAMVSAIGSLIGARA